MNRGERFQRELFSITVEQDAKLYGKFPLEKKSSLSRAVETFWTLIGVGLGTLIRAAPASWANAASHAMARTRAVESPAEGPDSGVPAGRAAVLIVTSHPETTPRESHLLGEMVQKALRLSDAVSPGSRFKLLQAVDDFALDTLRPSIKGLYQGIMSRAHIAMDRIPGTKIPAVEDLLRGSHYSRTIFHILKALRRGETVCLALPGGVIHNSRVLYVIREFAQRAYREVPRHRRAGESRREFELSVIRLFIRWQDGAALTGALNGAEEAALLALLNGRGIAWERISGLVSDLKEELVLLSPYRLRFFNVIFSRLRSLGRPLLVIPISHRDGKGRTGVFAGEPWKAGGWSEGREEELKGFIRRSFTSSPISRIHGRGDANA